MKILALIVAFICVVLLYWGLIWLTVLFSNGLERIKRESTRWLQERS